MGKQAFDQKIDALDSLRSAPPDEAAAALRKALKDRNNFLVSRAATVAGERGLDALIPDLATAFDRFLTDAVKTDPQCWAKNAIVKSLKDLGYDSADFFLRGIKHVQFEPVWGGTKDSAGTLRGACALALVSCALPRVEILKTLVDVLADAEKSVRIDAARAIAQLPGTDSALLLRLKALAGDKETEVIGQCFAGLLDIAPSEYIPFVARFLNADSDVAMEAAAALGECNDLAAVETLRESWKAHRDPQVKRGILLSLGVSRQPSAAEFLMSVISDADTDEAAVAIQALASGRFRDEFRERVSAAVASRDDARVTSAFQKEFH